MVQIGDFIARHWALWSALIALIGLLVGFELVRRQRGIRSVGPTEATLLMNKQDAVLLDLRDEGEYRQGHIVGAVHLPMSRLGERSKELERHRGKPLIAYCRTGQRSQQAGELLRRQGYTTVYSLSGGLAAWQQANLPLTRK